MRLEHETSIYQLGAIADDIGSVEDLANSKAKVFYQSSAPDPTQVTLHTDDVWYDSDDGNAMHKWTGSQWELQQFGTNAIVAGSITTAKLASQDVYTNFLLANFVTAAQASFSTLSAITADIGTVTAGILTSSDWDYDYDTLPIYPTAGMRISLNDKYIRTPNFAVINGNLYAQNVDVAGKITATSGSISGSLVTTGISASNISTGTLSADRIASNSITAAKLNVSTLSAITADLGTITAGSLNIGSGAFTVSSAGVLSATGATISGAITATSGNIGGFSIENNYQIIYRDQMTAGTAGTQYATFMRATDNGSAPTGSTAAFGVVHRGYNGSTYDASWVSDFIVRHDGDVYCYGGALHIADRDTNLGKILFPSGSIENTGSGMIVKDDYTVYVHAGNSNGYGAITMSAEKAISVGAGGDINIFTDSSSGGKILFGSANLDLTSSGMELVGTLQTSANINIVSANTAAYAVGVQNAAKKVQLYIASNGNMGVYNATDSHYVIYEDADNVIRMPQVYAKTNSGAANIYIDSYGRTYRSTSSSKRYKKSIKPLEDWKSVLDIPVVSFAYRKGYLSEDDQRYGVSVPGLIAEDVAEHYAVAAEISNGKAEDWNIRYIVPPMLAVEQDHERRIAELEAELARLKGGAA